MRHFRHSRACAAENKGEYWQITMKNMLKALIIDIDGVITDGKKYTDGLSKEIKSVAYKDMDAITDFQKEGVLVGCISGEDTAFSRSISGKLDYCSLGTKNKREMLEKFSEEYGIAPAHICYIGDGKYDIEALEYVGLAVCPNDAIEDVKSVSGIILNAIGGKGCIAELYAVLHKKGNKESNPPSNGKDFDGIIRQRMDEHCKMLERILEDRELTGALESVCGEIINSYRDGGQLFLCGNGGSAADAQHLAAELVGRFYMERKAFNAEALSTNTSIITALANDYDYSLIFARQVEAKGRKGDVLIGITTSGTSKNILHAFEKAKERGMRTVLMMGEIKGHLQIFEFADHIINMPSGDTPRIQEGHILIGHIMCEIIEKELGE